jgi:hypothetical protein
MPYMRCMLVLRCPYKIRSSAAEMHPAAAAFYSCFFLLLLLLAAAASGCCLSGAQLCKICNTTRGDMHSLLSSGIVHVCIIVLVHAFYIHFTRRLKRENCANVTSACCTRCSQVGCGQVTWVSLSISDKTRPSCWYCPLALHRHPYPVSLSSLK